MYKSWTQEPNRIIWWEYDYPCVINRNPLGSVSGYVGVGENHKAYNEQQFLGLSVHGGVTYTNQELPFNTDGLKSLLQSKKVIKNIWWIGFDCNHYNDIIPIFTSLYTLIGYPAQYHHILYVIEETRCLVKQLATSRISWVFISTK